MSLPDNTAISQKSLLSNATTVIPPSVKPRNSDVTTNQTAPTGRLQEIERHLAAAMRENNAEENEKNANEVSIWSRRKIQELHNMYPETDPDSFENRYPKWDGYPETCDVGSTK